MPVCLVPGLVKGMPAHIRVKQTQLPRQFLRLKELNGDVASAVYHGWPDLEDVDNIKVPLFYMPLLLLVYATFFRFCIATVLTATIFFPPDHRAMADLRFIY